MLTKFIVVFAVVALVAIAGSIPAKGLTYHVVIAEKAQVSGATLQPGEYKVTVNPDKVTFTLDKTSQEVPVKIETGEKKFSDNQVMFDNQGSQTLLKRISLGGTKTTLTFN